MATDIANQIKTVKLQAVINICDLLEIGILELFAEIKRAIFELARGAK